MKSGKILFLLLLLPCLTIAQSDLLVTASGDSLIGKIDILLPNDYFEEVIFKKDGKKTRYKAHQLRGFLKKGVTYKTVKMQNKYRIMQELQSGYLGLYSFRADNSYDFGPRYLYKATNEGIEVPNLTFKKVVSNFLRDCPAVEAKILDRTYKASNLDEMVVAYNNCLGTRPLVTENGEEKVKETKELKLITDITAKLQAANISEELNTLLQDITDKIKKGQKVPGYLKSALKEETADYTGIEEDIATLLGYLK